MNTRRRNTGGVGRSGGRPTDPGRHLVRVHLFDFRRLHAAASCCPGTDGRLLLAAHPGACLLLAHAVVGSGKCTGKCTGEGTGGCTNKCTNECTNECTVPDPRVACALDEHLAVSAEDWARDTGDRWRQCADVLYCRRSRPLGEAAETARQLLTGYPGCGLTAVPLAGDGWLVADRSAAVRIPRPPARPDFPVRRVERVRTGTPPLLVSALHGWLAAGHALGSLRSVAVAEPPGPNR